MHKKNRGRTACLYRSRWVPKGTNGNTHGYAEQTFVGSLPIDACSLSNELASRLSEQECLYVETSICRPAREAAEKVRREAEQREADPLWRLVEAARLVEESGQRSQQRHVPRAGVEAVENALKRVQVLEPVDRDRTSKEGPDPLMDALTAIRAAAAAVSGGAYGRAPEIGVRSTRPYRLWSDIWEAVCGAAVRESDVSLLRAMQDRGFAKTRQR